MRSLTHKCVRLTAVSYALLPCLTGCTGGPQHTVASPTAATGPMSDPITGLQPGTKALPAPAKPAEPLITESQLGIPFYPNAVPTVENGGEVATSGSGDAMILLQTHDSVEKVVAFYMEKLKGADAAGKPQPPIKSDSTMDGKPVVSLSQISGRTLKAAEIRQDDDKTLIELMRMDAPMPGSTTLPNNIPAPGSSATPGMGVTPGSSTTPGMGATPGIGATPGMGGTSGAPIESGSIAPGAKPQDPGLKYP